MHSSPRTLRVGAPFALALLQLGCAPRSTAAPPVVSVNIPPASGFAVADDSDELDEDPPGEDDGFRGRWEGTGVQNDGQTWGLVLRVAGHDREPCALVEYPPHDDWPVSCRGEWRCEKRASAPGHLVAIERILDGSDRCIDGCRIDADLRVGAVAFDCSEAGVTGEAEVHWVR